MWLKSVDETLSDNGLLEVLARRSPPSEGFVVDGDVAAMIFSMENASFFMRGSDEEFFVRSSLSDFSMGSSSLVVVMIGGLETLL